MKRLKYIIFKDDVAILFPIFLDHSNMVNGFIPQSAGFAEIDCSTSKIFAFGESMTLKLKSQPEDSEILTRTFIGL